MTIQKNRMFPFITDTCNPLGGHCIHGCIYCWSQSTKGLVNRFNMQKYRGQPTLYKKELQSRWKPNSFIFLCDMLDAFADDVPIENILAMLEIPRNNVESQFLLSTKNPIRYLDVLEKIPRNCVLGLTIEHNLKQANISYAPQPFWRLFSMGTVVHKDNGGHKVFCAIEPILKFELDRFVESIKRLNPWAVAVGYDNYHHKLPEPCLADTKELIGELEKFTVVYRKSLRKAWWEK